jgi:YD repeat-containing protein
VTASTVADPTIGGTAHPSTLTYSSGETDVVQPRDVAGAVPPTTTHYVMDAGHPLWVARVDSLVTTPGAPGPTTWATAYVHDASGNVCRTVQNATVDPTALPHPCTDALSGQTPSQNVDTRYTFDAATGYLTTQSDPLGIATTYEYTSDAYHDLLARTVTGNAGNPRPKVVKSYAYDTAHRVCREVDNPALADPKTLACGTVLSGTAADQNVEHRYAYDPATNLMTSVTDPLGVVESFGYDAYGDQTSATENYLSGQTPTDTVNVTTSYTYDAAGNVSSETAPVSAVGHVTVTTGYTYDSLGRGLSRNVEGDSTTPATREESVYDEFGEKVSLDRSNRAGKSNQINPDSRRSLPP